MISNYKRYFAFGCSYVNYGWGTLPDLIAANFEKYYNFGQGGASNTFILSRLIEANDIFQFNPETDFITVGVTGFGRFSILDRDNPRSWITSGDTIPNNPTVDIEDHQPEHDWRAKLFAKELDSYAWCVQRSHDAIQSIRHILQNTKVNCCVYPSIDNLLFTYSFDTKKTYKNYFNLTPFYQEMAQRTHNLYDVKESLDEFVRINKLLKGVNYDNGEFNGHPSLLCHYLYLQKHFPLFNTEKTLQRFNFLEQIFCKESHSEQVVQFTEKFSLIYRDKNINSYY